jgi:hypothetical protein
MLLMTSRNLELQSGQILVSSADISPESADTPRPAPPDAGASNLAHPFATPESDAALLRGGGEGLWPSTPHSLDPTRFAELHAVFLRQNRATPPGAYYGGRGCPDKGGGVTGPGIASDPFGRRSRSVHPKP